MKLTISFLLTVSFGIPVILTIDEIFSSGLDILLKLFQKFFKQTSKSSQAYVNSPAVFAFYKCNYLLQQGFYLRKKF